MLLQRRQRVTLLLAVLYCACSLLPLGVTARARDKDNRRRSDRISAGSTSAVSSASSVSYYGGGGVGGAGGTSSSYPEVLDKTSICTRRRDMKLMCYCTPDENHVPVQKAECWVFADGLLQNDTTWTRFYQQKRLREIKFIVQKHGRLDYIPTMLLDQLRNLTSITVEYSQVEIVRGNTFASLPYLERIALTNNQIMALDQDAFVNNIRMRDLNLEHNQIYEIDRHAFRNLPLCERVSLNNNNISSLHEGLFAEMSRLVYLNLAYNQISVLTSEIFKGLGNLNVLKLTHNNINFIGDTVFAELWSLVELELDDNRIERISERALDGLNNLKTLNLRNNLLKKIDNGLLRGTPALLSINVQSNDLETLTIYTFQPIMDNLVNSTSELLLSDNSIICDCRLQWIFELKNRTRHLQLRDSLEEFVCTLQEPQLANFVEPVPSHILDLLNIAGSRKRQPKSRPAQRGQRLGSLHSPLVAVPNIPEQQSPKQKRSLSQHFGAGGVGGGSIDGVVGGGSEKFLHSEQLAGVKSRQPTSPIDYYDEMHDQQLTQQVDMNDNNGRDDDTDDGNNNNDDDVGALQRDALHNDVLATNLLDSTSERAGVAKIGAAMGFKVRLFALKPDHLPCHDELSDPTELPLSRDLMDVRSNLPSNSSSPSLDSRLLMQGAMATTLLLAWHGLGAARGFGAPHAA